MSSSHPYTSSQGSLVKAFEQFRKSFPTTVDAATLQKFSIAPANESYVINTLRFLGLIDDVGKKSDSKIDFFFGDDVKFAAGLDTVLREAYVDLFSELGDEPWTSTREQLAVWFRVTDKTSDLIGSRQASTFLTLASLAGHGEPSKPVAASTALKSPASKTPKAATTKRVSKADHSGTGNAANVGGGGDRLSGGSVGLTVRVEVNLPAGGSAETYDAIFASIRKNLIDQ